MNKLKTFWYVFKNSLIDPTYYNDVIKAPFSFSAKYFVVFYFFLALISAGFFIFKDLPKFKAVSTEATQLLDQHYPQDLVLSVQDNTLDIAGAESPLVVPFPEDGFDSDMRFDYDNLMIFDENNSDTEDVFLNFNPNSFTIRYPDDEKQTISYQDLDISFTLNRTLVDEFVSESNEIIQSSSQFLIAGYFIFSGIFYPIAMIFFLGILSGMIYIATFFGQQKLSYKQTYQIGIHALTFAESARFLQELLFQGMNLPSIFTLAFFGASFLALWSIKPVK